MITYNTRIADINADISLAPASKLEGPDVQPVQANGAWYAGPYKDQAAALHPIKDKLAQPGAQLEEYGCYGAGPFPTAKACAKFCEEQFGINNKPTLELGNSVVWQDGEQRWAGTVYELDGGKAVVRRADGERFSMEVFSEKDWYKPEGQAKWFSPGAATPVKLSHGAWDGVCVGNLVKLDEDRGMDNDVLKVVAHMTLHKDIDKTTAEKIWADMSNKERQQAMEQYRHAGDHFVEPPTDKGVQMQGRSAFEAGKQPTDNPYQPEDQRNAWWKQGYEDKRQGVPEQQPEGSTGATGPTGTVGAHSEKTHRHKVSKFGSFDTWVPPGEGLPGKKRVPKAPPPPVTSPVEDPSDWGLEKRKAWEYLVARWQSLKHPAEEQVKDRADTLEMEAKIAEWSGEPNFSSLDPKVQNLYRRTYGYSKGGTLSYPEASKLDTASFQPNEPGQRDEDYRPGGKEYKAGPMDKHAEGRKFRILKLDNDYDELDAPERFIVVDDDDNEVHTGLFATLEEAKAFRAKYQAENADRYAVYDVVTQMGRDIDMWGPRFEQLMQAVKDAVPGPLTSRNIRKALEDIGYAGELFKEDEKELDPDLTPQERLWHEAQEQLEAYKDSKLRPFLDRAIHTAHKLDVWANDADELTAALQSILTEQPDWFPHQGTEKFADIATLVHKGWNRLIGFTKRAEEAGYHVERREFEPGMPGFVLYRNNEYIAGPFMAEMAAWSYAKDLMYDDAEPGEDFAGEKPDYDSMKIFLNKMFSGKQPVQKPQQPPKEQPKDGGKQAEDEYKSNRVTNKTKRLEVPPDVKNLWNRERGITPRKPTDDLVKGNKFGAVSGPNLTDRTNQRLKLGDNVISRDRNGNVDDTGRGRVVKLHGNTATVHCHDGEVRTIPAYSLEKYDESMSDKANFAHSIYAALIEYSGIGQPIRGISKYDDEVIVRWRDGSQQEIKTYQDYTRALARAKEDFNPYGFESGMDELKRQQRPSRQRGGAAYPTDPGGAATVAKHAEVKYAVVRDGKPVAVKKGTPGAFPVVQGADGKWRRQAVQKPLTKEEQVAQASGNDQPSAVEAVKNFGKAVAAPIKEGAQTIEAGLQKGQQWTRDQANKVTTGAKKVGTAVATGANKVAGVAQAATQGVKNVAQGVKQAVPEAGRVAKQAVGQAAKATGGWLDRTAHAVGSGIKKGINYINTNSEDGDAQMAELPGIRVKTDKPDYIDEKVTEGYVGEQEFQEGFGAYVDGKRLDAAPYKDGTFERAAWQTGWRAAKKSATGGKQSEY